MASIVELAQRDWGCGYGYYWSNGGCQRYGDWYYWGRWVVAAVVVGIFLLFFIACL